MNKTDRWISQCSCGVNTIHLYTIDEKEQEYLIKRRGYLAMLEDSNYHDTFVLEKPFIHIDHDSNDKFYNGIVNTLDPLISGLVLELLDRKFRTITSCQGKYGSCPYIYTYADTNELESLSKLFNNEDSYTNHWNNILISFEGIRGVKCKNENEPTFLIQFYDAISMLYHYKKITGLNPYNIPEDIFIYNSKK